MTLGCIYEHPEIILPRIAKAYMPFDSVLDVGGGPATIAKNSWGTRNIHVIDIWTPETIPENFILGNGLDAENIYGPKSFDCVVASEIIEHLPKEDGERFLEGLEAVARKLVIVTTPRGFTPQDPAKVPDEPWANNPYQKHLCGYYPEEFLGHGYCVVMNGGIEGGQIIAWRDTRESRP